MPRMKAAAGRALALDDTLAITHVRMADALCFNDWDWAGAEREFRALLDMHESTFAAISTFIVGVAWAAAVRVKPKKGGMRVGCAALVAWCHHYGLPVGAALVVLSAFGSGLGSSANAVAERAVSASAAPSESMREIMGQRLQGEGRDPAHSHRSPRRDGRGTGAAVVWMRPARESAQDRK